MQAAAPHFPFSNHPKIDRKSLSIKETSLSYSSLPTTPRRMSHPLAKRSDSSLPTPPRSPTGIKPTDPQQLGDIEALKTTSATTSPSLHGGQGAFGPMTPSDGLNQTAYFPAITPVQSSDPLLLATKLQTEETISALRKRKNGGKTGAFYSKQNAHIASLLKSMDQHILEAEEEEDSNRLAVRTHSKLLLSHSY